jgi:hypothetical protein
MMSLLQFPIINFQLSITAEQIFNKIPYLKIENCELNIATPQGGAR